VRPEQQPPSEQHEEDFSRGASLRIALVGSFFFCLIFA